MSKHGRNSHGSTLPRGSCFALALCAILGGCTTAQVFPPAAPSTGKRQQPYRPVAELRALRAEKAANMQTILAGIRTAQGRAIAAGAQIAPKDTAALQAGINEYENEERELAQLDHLITNMKEAPKDAVPRQAEPMALGTGMIPTSRAPAALPDMGGGPRLFNSLFPGVRLDAGGFRDFGEFARCVRDRDPRLFENSSGMSTGVGAEGGFYLPAGFAAGLIDGSLQMETVRPRCTVLPVTNAAVAIPLFDTTARNAGIAGLDGKLTAEGSAATAQKATIAQLELRPRKLVAWVPCTEELIADSPAIFATLLQRYMVEAISARIDYEALAGNGVGMMLGIIAAPCTVSVAKETNQVAATIVPANIAKMIARLAPGSFAKAVWVVSPSALSALFVMTQVTKNVAGTENVGGHAPEFFSVLPNGDFSLLGRPLVVSDRLPALGTVGDVLCADFSQFVMALRQDITLAIDTSRGFVEGEIYFKATMRIDGMPMLKSAITPRVGSDSLSPFVTLATRG